MKILIAPDKFKGSLTAKQACEAISDGLLHFEYPTEVVHLPLADGGDGLLEVLKEYSEWEERTVTVADPLFRKINASYLVSKDKIAFIEMAKASGLLLLTETERNPLKTSSYGTGELIKNAIANGVNKIVLGIGGSATNDAGIGMAAALGYKFLNKAGNALPPIGGSLTEIDQIDASGIVDLAEIKFEIACDVKNPLVGRNGAARIYAPQKGATVEMVSILEEGLINFARVVQDQFGINVDTIPGAGAAGGLGAGGLVFLNASLKSGIELLLEYSKAENKIIASDIVISGEGKLDEQSLQGKVVSAIAALCEKHQKPLIILCGKNELSYTQFRTSGIKAVYSISDLTADHHDAISNASYWMEELTKRAVSDILDGST